MQEKIVQFAFLGFAFVSAIRLIPMTAHEQEI